MNRIEYAPPSVHHQGMKQCSVDTPFGLLTVTESEGAITALDWGGLRRSDTSALLDSAMEQLAAYAVGQREVFNLPLRVVGSAFQRDVCAAISAIPFGYTRTYGEIARDLGVPAQAVGQACGGNPIPVIIPCHRVMGAKGLTGFSGRGGVETKVALLRHEKAAGLLI
jgi:methylated-DNA-[protein]-cysteine S-methyltransferase